MKTYRDYVQEQLDKKEITRDEAEYALRCNATESKYVRDYAVSVSYKMQKRYD